MEPEMKDLKEEVYNIKQDVEQILFILTGTEYEKGQGLVDRIAQDKLRDETRYDKLEKRLHDKNEKLEARIDKLEKWKDKVVWVGIGLAFGSGIGITELFRIIFFK